MQKILALLLILISSAAHAEPPELYTPAYGDFLKEADRAIITSANKFNLNTPDVNSQLPMTPALIAAIENEDANQRQRNCDGTEDLGYICGLNYNPIICSVHLPDVFFYNVISKDDYTATVYSSWNEKGDNPVKYKLINQNETWKIDSISCPHADSFNDW